MQLTSKLTIVTPAILAGALISTCAPARAQVADGNYAIIATTTGNALDCTGCANTDGTPIQLWGYWGGSCQQWHIGSLGNGLYSIRNLNPDGSLGLSLDCTGCSPNDLTQLELWDYWGGPCQQWAITSTGANNYKISTANPKADGTFDNLDGEGCSGAPGTHVILWSWDGGGCQQQWQLMPLQTSSSTWRPAYGDYAYVPGTSVQSMMDQAAAIPVQTSKQILYYYIDENWTAISAYTGQTDKTKMYALADGWATRESTFQPALETATDGGFTGDSAHAYGLTQCAITAFSNDLGFLPDNDVPEITEYPLTSANFYDEGISVLMGFRHFLHFIKQAQADGAVGVDVVRNGLKGYNTGWANPTDDPGYYASYPDEIGALAQWYYVNGHLTDDVWTWTNDPRAATERQNPWGWW